MVHAGGCGVHCYPFGVGGFPMRASLGWLAVVGIGLFEFGCHGGGATSQVGTTDAGSAGGGLGGASASAGGSTGAAGVDAGDSDAATGIGVPIGPAGGTVVD